MDATKLMAGMDNALQNYFDALTQTGYNASWDKLLVYDMCNMLASYKDSLSAEDIKTVDNVVCCLRQSCLIAYPSYVERIKNTMSYESISTCTPKIHLVLCN